MQTSASRKDGIPSHLEPRAARRRTRVVARARVRCGCERANATTQRDGARFIDLTHTTSAADAPAAAGEDALHADGGHAAAGGGGGQRHRTIVLRRGTTVDPRKVCAVLFRSVLFCSVLSNSVLFCFFLNVL